MYFRTKTIKDSKLVQLVESYRNEEGHLSQYRPTGRGKCESRHNGKTWRVRGEAAGIKIEVAASEKEQDGNIRFRI